MALRLIPQNPHATVTPGWCFTRQVRPVDCSWCGEKFEVIGVGDGWSVVWCDVCDEPKPPAVWGTDPQDHDFDDEEG